MTMSLAEYRTAALWRQFMSQNKNILNRVSDELISLQHYPADYFTNFSPKRTFEKWALAEVADFSGIPEGMQSFELKSGLYAVFHYKGLNTDTSIFQYIYSEWLPDSEYVLDQRPHFEVLGKNYRNNDPLSEEDLYIPVKLKL